MHVLKFPQSFLNPQFCNNKGFRLTNFGYRLEKKIKRIYNFFHYASEKSNGNFETCSIHVLPNDLGNLNFD